jgi:hypothetical protein
MKVRVRSICLPFTCGAASPAPRWFVSGMEVIRAVTDKFTFPVTSLFAGTAVTIAILLVFLLVSPSLRTTKTDKLSTSRTARSACRTVISYAHTILTFRKVYHSARLRGTKRSSDSHSSTGNKPFGAETGGNVAVRRKAPPRRSTRQIAQPQNNRLERYALHDFRGYAKFDGSRSAG